jgi:hypothetical protein
MGKEFRRFFLFMVLSICILVGSDFVIGKFLDRSFNGLKYGERARGNFAITRSVADVYVFGSSRALGHYNSNVISDSLNLIAYNAGRPAQSLFYHLAVFKSILKRKTPKIVILDLNENELQYDKKKYELLSSLLPFYKKDKDIRQLINSIRPGYKYFGWSNILPYNSSVFSVTTRNFLPVKKSEIDSNGFVPYRGRRGFEIDSVENCNQRFNHDPKLIEALEEFVKICRAKKIHLIVAISPRFVHYQCEPPGLILLKEEFRKQQIPFYDFSRDQQFVTNPEYMYDEAHLNFEGSLAYTNRIIAILRKQNL